MTDATAAAGSEMKHTPDNILAAIRDTAKKSPKWRNDKTFDVLTPRQIAEVYLDAIGDKKTMRLALQYIAPLALTFTDDDRDALREHAQQCLARVSNRIKTDELDGRRVTVHDMRYLDTKFGGTYQLTISFDDGDDTAKQFECWLPGSSNSQPYRFFTSRGRDALPTRVVFRKSPHKFTDKNGQLQDGVIWRVERLPDQLDAFSEVPF